jgi:hypothetical protein
MAATVPLKMFQKLKGSDPRKAEIIVKAVKVRKPRTRYTPLENTPISSVTLEMAPKARPYVKLPVPYTYYG